MRKLKRMLFTMLLLPILPILGTVPEGDPPSGDPPAAPPPAPPPPPEPPKDPPAEPPAEPPDNPEVANLQRQIEAANKKLKDAESALASEKSEHAKLKRSTKTDAELLEEKQKEVEENAKKYQRMIAGAEAKQVLAGTGLSEEDYSPILELITSEDSEKTKAIATEVSTLLANQSKLLEKALREKILKETPVPPAGGGDPEKDTFTSAFNNTKY